MANRPGRPPVCNEPTVPVTVRLPVSVYDSIIRTAAIHRVDIAVLLRAFLAGQFRNPKSPSQPNAA